MHGEPEELIGEQESQCPAGGGEKPRGLMGLDGPPPCSQESTPRPTALPVMPRVSVAKGLDGSRNGNSIRASNPARLPKPIQTSMTCSQVCATGESSGIGSGLRRVVSALAAKTHQQSERMHGSFRWQTPPYYKKTARAADVPIEWPIRRPSILDASRASLPSPRRCGVAARCGSSPQPRCVPAIPCGIRQ